MGKPEHKAVRVTSMLMDVTIQKLNPESMVNFTVSAFNCPGCGQRVAGQETIFNAITGATFGKLGTRRYCKDCGIEWAEQVIKLLKGDVA